MSSEWPRTTFDQLCDIKRGASPRPIHDWLAPTGIPWVKISDATASASPFINKTADFIRPEGAGKSVEVFPGDFILSNSATPGIPKFMQIYACVHDGWLLLRNFRGLDQWYCYYLLQTERENLIRQGNGSVFTNLKTEILKKHEVTVPPLDYQRKVAAFLRSLDDRITLLRETNATLEAIAQALFKSWFVDFDPVRAKMEGRAPEGMDEATAALFPDSFEETELGAVPRGWRLVPFGQLLGHTIGGDWGSEVPDEKNDTQVAIIRGTDIPDLQSSRDCRVPIRYTSQKKLSTRRLQDGDIVIEVSGGSKEQPTGRALYVTDDLLHRFDCPIEPASFCRLFRPANRQVGVLLAQHLRYIYDQGKTWEYQNQSTGIANFQTTHFLEKELVVVPPDTLLGTFSETVRALVDRTVNSQIDELSQIRDTLLPRLISGQLRLPEAQAELEAA
jgi:type I restriction enzyme S subunit